MAELREHFIVCGCGRVGSEVARALAENGVDFVVIESDEEAVSEVSSEGYLHLLGDASQDDTLKAAGIERARGLVAALGSDSDNVLVTLSAKALNPELTVVARSSFPETVDKLRMAGADRVVSPSAIGGRRMALSAVRPMAVDFFDTMFHGSHTGARISEVEVTDGSRLAGRKVTNLNFAEGVQVLAIARTDGQLLLTPDGESAIRPGDNVMLVGPAERLDRLEAGE